MYCHNCSPAGIHTLVQAKPRDKLFPNAVDEDFDFSEGSFPFLNLCTLDEGLIE